MSNRSITTTLYALTEMFYVSDGVRGSRGKVWVAKVHYIIRYASYYASVR